MKKFVLIFLSVFMLSTLSAQENHLESADTGVLVEIVGQIVPPSKIEIINPTCVIGMTNVEAAGGVPYVVYSYWSGDYGIYENTLGMMFQNTEVITLIMMFDKEMNQGAEAVKDWIKENSPKDDVLIENQARKIMKQYNNNDGNYVLFRAQEQQKEMSRIIVLIYSTKELARQNGFSVD